MKMSVQAVVRHISIAISKQVRADECNGRGTFQLAKNADSANPKLSGEGVSVSEGFGEKRPSPFHFFCTKEILMPKFSLGEKD